MRWWIAVALLTISCGGAPTAPSQTPQPTPTPTPAPTFTGTVTDTVTGAPVTGYAVLLAGSRLTITAPGYVTRETANGPAVDLIHDVAPFDLGFYRQLVRNGYEAPGSLEPLRRLMQAPSIYLQTTGLSPATVAALEGAARMAVDEWSGHAMGVVTWETGTEARAVRSGWITVLSMDEPSGCGRANVGLSAGQIWLNVTNPLCSMLSTLPHELGHAMGFYHVEPAGSLMKIPRPITDNRPTAAERYHASIAYHRSPGNRDLDSDSLTSSLSTAARMVVD